MGPQPFDLGRRVYTFLCQVLIDTVAARQPWECSPGMVVTYVAIGHVPDKKEKHTRPVHLLMECRKLFHG